MSQNQDTDWQTVLFSPENRIIDRLDKIAERHFLGDATEAQIAVSELLDKLVENDYAKLKKGKNIANPVAFIITVATNHIRDKAVAKFGRCRSPKWIDALGSIWVEVHKKLCCYKAKNAQIISSLVSNAFTETYLENVIAEIKSKHAKCGSELRHFEHVSIGDGESANLSMGSIESTIETEDFELVVVMLAKQCFNQEVPQRNKFSQALSSLSQLLDLSPRQIIILKLTFQEGYSISKSAAMLNLKRHKVDTLLTDALTQIRQAFEKCGLKF
jgi:DNA-binding CsgD family transcriptional regulator